MYVMSCVSLAAFKILCLYMAFVHLTMYLWVDLFKFILLGVHLASWKYRLVFYQIWVTFVHYFFIIPPPPLFLPLGLS